LLKKLDIMAQIRKEIYDDAGLAYVEYLEVDEPTQEELFAQKEAELLAMYAELQALKGQ
jgi:hypothetical protein